MVKDAAAKGVSVKKEKETRNGWLAKVPVYLCARLPARPATRPSACFFFCQSVGRSVVCMHVWMDVGGCVDLKFSL